MTWVVWRQYRFTAAISGAILAAFAVLLLVTGLQVAAQWHTALTECAHTGTCGNLASNLTLGSPAISFLIVMTLGVPVLIGLFLGAPLIAREFETGTGQFAWTQSVTRKRWLAVTTGWMMLASAVCAGAVSALVTWWSGPDNALQSDAFKPGRFDIMGLVPVGYALFATALAIAAGAILRRTLTAMGVTLIGFLALRFVVFNWVRPHCMTAITRVYGFTANYTPSGSYWQVSSGAVSPSGQFIYPQSGPGIQNVPIGYLPASCKALMHQGEFQALMSCIQKAGFRNFITYQPANRYWAFQWIETGIFVALAAALIAITFVVTSRRDA